MPKFANALLSQTRPPRPRPSRFGLVRFVHLAAVALVLVGVLSGASPAQAQLSNSIPVSGFDLTDAPAVQSNFPNTPFTTPCAPNNFTGCNTGAVTNLTFGAGRNTVLNAVTVAGNRFEPATDLLPPVGLAQRIVFRRNTGAGLPNRELLFFEQITSNAANVTLNPSAVGSIEEAMLSSTINRGIDNVFNNISEVAPGGNGQETANNIERIDYLIAVPGVSVPVADQGDVGFLILERGGNDAFKIAAITAVDGLGNPTAYGPLVSVNATSWGNINDLQISTTVLRRDNLADNTPPLFRPSHRASLNQPVRGIFFPISSLVQAPQNAQPIFGYSLFADDITAANDLVNFLSFPTNTSGNNAGGIDLIAGGFGLIRRVSANLSLVKRVTNLFGPTPLPNFAQVVGDGAGLGLLQSNGLGQGLDTIIEPTVQPGNGIEYTVYVTNPGSGAANDLVLCDQIPIGTTFDPSGYGAGRGIQAIAPSSPAGPLVNYTNAADGDPGQFIAPGAALPTFCGVNQGNGAVVVNVGTVGPSQVGLVRFRVTVSS